MSGDIRNQPRSPKNRSWLRLASYGLIAVGIVLLVIAGVNVGYRQWDKQRSQVRLTQVALTSSAQAPPTLAVGATATSTVASSEPTEVAAAATVPAATLQATPQPTSATSEPPLASPEPTGEASPAGSLPVRIAIPDLGIDARVGEMGWRIEELNGARTSVWRLEDIGNGMAGHLLNSALPGQPDNVVIAGHHNIEGQVFKGISDAWTDEGADVLKENVQWSSSVLNGRTIMLQDAAGRQFTYVVQAMYKLADQSVSPEQRLENGRFMAPTVEPTLTLVTCWPRDGNSHRIVVVATLVAGEG